jgi:hypothetical protein
MSNLGTRGAGVVALMLLVSVGGVACGETTDAPDMPHLAIYDGDTPGLSTHSDRRWGTEITAEGGFDAQPLMVLSKPDVESVGLRGGGALLDITLTEEAFTDLISDKPWGSERLVCRLTSEKGVIWGWLSYGGTPPSGPSWDVVVIFEDPDRLRVNSAPTESGDSVVEILFAGWS